MFKNWQTKKQKGFTLVEILITITIMTFIAGLSLDLLLKPAMGLTLDNTITDFIDFFQYVQEKNEIFATSTDNIYIIRFANTTSNKHYYASYIGTPSAETIDKFYLLDNVVFTSPTSGNNLDLRFCYAPTILGASSDLSPKLLCDDNNSKICDQTYTITIRSAAFDISRSLIISTSSTDYCVPKLTKSR